MTEPINLCMKCHTKPVQTMVLPCMHYVICHDCSETLKNTECESKCLECGETIESVLDEQKIEGVIEPKAIEDEGINLCIMCETNPVQTIVLPCMHNIVCHQCSVGLKGTNNKELCIICRQEIETVLDEMDSF